MAKQQQSPAFLFYTDNFMGGTMFFTDEQVGKYIRLLCAQHTIGHLSREHMLQICKGEDKIIFDKFDVDENGLYYNSRLDLEINKRVEYSKSRSKNRGIEPTNIKNNFNKNGHSNDIPIVMGHALDKDAFRGQAQRETDEHYFAEQEVWGKAKDKWEQETGRA